jgi:ketosteroid isomerase-like protein
VSTEDAVRRYYEVVGDLSSTRDDLLALLHPEVRVVEHPNAIVPAGAEHELEGVLAGFEAGKRLLSRQSFAIHEVIVAGERAAVRATWRGTVSRDAGRFSGGEELEAEVAGFLTFREGRVLAQETLDCYPPFGGD